MRWLVRGDVDGFFGLALDNLVQLLVIDLLCRTVLGFSPGLIELGGALVAERIRRAAPRAALLSTLAGIWWPFRLHGIES
jgi:hypothetical protein